MEKSFSVGGETERDAVLHIERRVWRSGGRSVETGGTACRMERGWREKQRRMDGGLACQSGIVAILGLLAAGVWCLEPTRKIPEEPAGC